MRHADFDIAATPAAMPTAATRPTVGLGGGSGFGGIFGTVQEEVASFIQHGGGGFSVASVAGASLSPEGAVAQARASQAANAIVGDADTAPDQQAFLESIAPWAKEAADKLGVAPELVSAHAALESGWGQRPLRNSDGSSTYNLFGIKAGAGWHGDVAESPTTEYVGGAALKTSARFRAYPDQASAFRDYAQMLIDNPRFRGVLKAGSDAHAFAQGLAKGGYATDPSYAAKLSRLAGKLQGLSG